MTARLFPVFGGSDNLHVIADPLESAPEGVRTVGIGELTVADGHVSDRAGSFRVALADLFWGPIFVSSVRSFDPFGGRGSGRVTIGRTVVRRASWSAPANELPAEPETLARWAREQGMPRRVFVRSPLQRKPIYADLESSTLLRVLARFLAPVAEHAPTAPILFTEMLPGPDDCWLEDSNGHYTSEFRIVAVDTSRRPRRATQSGALSCAVQALREIVIRGAFIVVRRMSLLRTLSVPPRATTNLQERVQKNANAACARSVKVLHRS